MYEDFISKLNPNGETIVQSFISGLEGASGLAVDTAGNIYVSQDLELPLRKYDSNGNLVFEFESHRPEFTDPNSLTLTDDGRLLAGVGSTSNLTKWRVLAFDVQTGNRLADFTPEFESKVRKQRIFFYHIRSFGTQDLKMAISNAINKSTH